MGAQHLPLRRDQEERGDAFGFDDVKRGLGVERRCGHEDRGGAEHQREAGGPE